MRRRRRKSNKSWQSLMGKLRCEDEQDDDDETNLSSLSLLQQPDSERGDADRKSEVSTGSENAGFEPETLGPTTVTERVGWPLDGHVFSQSVCDKYIVTKNSA